MLQPSFVAFNLDSRTRAIGFQKSSSIPNSTCAMSVRAVLFSVHLPDPFWSQGSEMLQHIYFSRQTSGVLAFKWRRSSGDGWRSFWRSSVDFNLDFHFPILVYLG